MDEQWRRNRRTLCKLQRRTAVVCLQQHPIPKGQEVYYPAAPRVSRFAAASACLMIVLYRSSTFVIIDTTCRMSSSESLRFSIEFLISNTVLFAVSNCDISDWSPRTFSRLRCIRLVRLFEEAYPRYAATAAPMAAASPPTSWIVTGSTVIASPAYSLEHSGSTSTEDCRKPRKPNL